MEVLVRIGHGDLEGDAPDLLNIGAVDFVDLKEAMVG
jgi:hypothetical protein